MAKINAILDEEVDYGFEGGPEYSTALIDLENGFEDSDAEWKYPKHQYSASFGDIDDPDRDNIIEVFHACRGRHHCFMFKDWNDYKIEGQVIAVRPATTEKIQLYKTYQPEGWPAFTVRPIQALAAAVILDENDDEVAGTFDVLTGEFIPVGAWGGGVYRLYCEFYVWVRFDDDYNSMTINSWRANTAKVRLIEKKFKFDSLNVPHSWEE